MGAAARRPPSPPIYSGKKVAAASRTMAFSSMLKLCFLDCVFRLSFEFELITDLVVFLVALPFVDFLLPPAAPEFPDFWFPAPALSLE